MIIYSISSIYAVDQRSINSSIKTAKMLEKKNEVESAISIYKSLDSMKITIYIKVYMCITTQMYI